MSEADNERMGADSPPPAGVLHLAAASAIAALAAWAVLQLGYGPFWSGRWWDYLAAFLLVYILGGLVFMSLAGTAGFLGRRFSVAVLALMLAAGLALAALSGDTAAARVERFLQGASAVLCLALARAAVHDAVSTHDAQFFFIPMIFLMASCVAPRLHEDYEKRAAVKQGRDRAAPSRCEGRLRLPAAGDVQGTTALPRECREARQADP